MATAERGRTNRQWVEELGAGDRRTEDALVDLRRFLRGVLGKTLRGRRRLDDEALAAATATDDPSSETRLHRRQLLEAIARAIRNDLTEKRWAA